MTQQLIIYALGSSFERACSAQVHETDPNVSKLYERLF